MACDYRVIRADNETKYGTDIGRIGSVLLADRYDDRSHFIYELLQNAEDALAKRQDSPGTRSVRFDLSKSELRISHFGKPFDDADVRGICGIVESTKDDAQIGRFGIGFKSVYAFTDRPEVHSGSEDFAIENYVLPVAAASICREPDETVIVMPLEEAAARGEIETGLRSLDPAILLFLREIEEIEWTVEGGPSGLYLRDSDLPLDGNPRRVTVIGQAGGQQDTDQAWLVFSSPMHAPDDKFAGNVEVAFSLEDERVTPIHRSPLVVFFPTVVETYLGFRIQGPYRTTPSRDNISRQDSWNQHCVRRTADVLVDALCWFRDRDRLDADVLRCLPLDQGKFDENSIFAPLYDVTRQAIISQSLLPCVGEGYVAAGNAILGRTSELRDLLDSDQLTQLFGGDRRLEWLSGSVSQAPELRQYLIRECQVNEIRPETVLPKIDTAFMSNQSDDWVQKFYEFMSTQVALTRQAKKLPLIRLKEGEHVRAGSDDQLQAFLPGKVETGFPTVRVSVCSTTDSLAFLKSLGLTEPDPVEDVIRNILPKYRTTDPRAPLKSLGLTEPDPAEDVIRNIPPKYSDEEHSVAGDTYESDVQRIIGAFSIDSRERRDRLVSALRKTPFVRAVDAGDGTKCQTRPRDLYIATERLKSLFEGIAGIKLVDDSCAVLRGEKARDLLEACGSVRYLRPIKDTSLSGKERRELRAKTGQKETSNRNDQIEDWTLQGISEVLSALPEINTETRKEKAKQIWEELINLEERRGKAVFSGEYTWTYYGDYRAPPFDSAFIRLLNKSEWVPDDEGDLRRPDLILFGSLGWTSNPFLQSKICFKPPVINQLAEEAGIEPEVLDLLKIHGITSKSELVARLRLTEAENSEGNSGGIATPEEAIGAILGDAADAKSPVGDSERGHAASVGSTGAQSSTMPPGRRASGTGRHGGGERGGASGGSGRGSGKRASGNGRDRSFISYVAVHPDGDESDPDGLEQSARMALEAKAIDLILSQEPNWKHTPTHNPGFDLFEPGPDGETVRWCEVKAMTGSLNERPVGLSRAQFEFARERRTAYWLYVVEHVENENPRIVRIRDPAGKVRTFSFDRGWIAIAEMDSEPGHIDRR